jgi:hypothetical protein
MFHRDEAAQPRLVESARVAKWTRRCNRNGVGPHLFDLTAGSGYLVRCRPDGPMLNVANVFCEFAYDVDHSGKDCTVNAGSMRRTMKNSKANSSKLAHQLTR